MSGLTIVGVNRPMDHTDAVIQGALIILIQVEHMSFG